MDYRQLSRLVAAGRTVIGIAALLAPGAALHSLGGDPGGPARLITRAFGGRELALGLGALRSLDHDPASQDWITAGATADVADAAAAVLALRSVGPIRAITGAVIASGAAAVGFRAAGRLD